MSAASRALAIVNPVAAGGRGRHLARTLAADFRAAGMSIEVAVTQRPADAARLAAEAVDDGYRTLIAVGGDGTANEVANGMIGSEAALGLYPIGSGNDLSRSLGYPRRRRALAPFLAAAAARMIDVGDVNGRVFLNAAGAGIDGHAAERIGASARVVGNRLGYLVGAVVSIATYRPKLMEVRIDGQLEVGRFLAVVASNGRYFGNGMLPAPRAELDDGYLDVTVAGDLGRIESLRALGRLYRGTHENGTTITTRRAREIDLQLERPTAFQADGEVMRADRISIRIRPAAIAMLAGP